MAKSLSPSDICPMDLGINILSGKWKLRILWNIYNKKIIRFNELEDKKIIKRTVYPEIPPKVEYSLTETGKTIEPVLKSLCEWGKEYMKSSK